MARVSLVEVASGSTSSVETVTVTVPSGDNYGCIRGISVAITWGSAEGAVTGKYIVGTVEDALGFVAVDDATLRLTTTHANVATGVLIALHSGNHASTQIAQPWACDSATIAIQRTGGTGAVSYKVNVVYEQ